MEHMEREREIKKCWVTKRELLNKLSNIYKCKVSPDGTFSLGNFLFNERDLSGLFGAQREKIYILSTVRERKLAKNRGICAARTCIPQYREYPGGGGLTVFNPLNITRAVGTLQEVSCTL